MLKSVKGSLFFVGGLLLLALLLMAGQAQRQQGGLTTSAEKAFIGKDVVADILPPPLYLIEMRLALSQAAEGTLPADEAVKIYNRLLAEYNQRAEYWTKNPPLGLEKKLLGRQHDAAKAFIAAAKTEVLDKVTSGDKEAAQRNLTKVHALYAEHRSGVDDTVIAANEMATQSSKEFNSKAQQSSLTLWGFCAAMAVGLFILISRYVAQIVKPIWDSSEFARGISSGDLTRTLEVCDKVEVARLQTALIEMQNSLRKIVGEVRQSTDSISHSSSEIAHGNLDLSHRTEQTAANLPHAASSMQHVTSTVKHSADSARQANQLASNAAEVAARGGQVVSQVVSTMDEINASSKKISDIIGVIDGIAFQTNILALNAAVEAARAGEQGRGFAVVASEVRSLAGRSAEAAKEIKTLIGASVERVETGSRLVEDAGSTMKEIVTSVQRVSDIISEISSAAAEQSDGISQVNTSVVQLDQMTQQNAALVEEGAAAAESLRDQAKRLAQLLDTFKLGAQMVGEHSASFGSSPAAPRGSRTARPAPPARARRETKAPSQSAHRQSAAHSPSPAAPAPAATPSSQGGSNGDSGWESF